MSRFCVRLILAICFVIVAGGTSEASFWGWLEELSGPGPFRRVSWAPLNGLFCFNGGHIDARASYDDGASKCLYLERMVFESKNDRLIRIPDTAVGATIQAETFDAGISFKIVSGLELGVGAGLISFTTKERHVTSTRFVLVPGRLSFTPARMIVAGIVHVKGAEVGKKKYFKYLNMFQYFVKSRFIAGTLTGNDFGAPEVPFRASGDFVGSYGLLIDVSQLWK